MDINKILTELPAASIATIKTVEGVETMEVHPRNTPLHGQSFHTVFIGSEVGSTYVMEVIRPRLKANSKVWQCIK